MEEAWDERSCSRRTKWPCRHNCRVLAWLDRRTANFWKLGSRLQPDLGTLNTMTGLNWASHVGQGHLWGKSVTRQNLFCQQWCIHGERIQKKKGSKRLLKITHARHLRGRRQEGERQSHQAASCASSTAARTSLEEVRMVVYHASVLRTNISLKDRTVFGGALHTYHLFVMNILKSYSQQFSKIYHIVVNYTHSAWQ